MTYALARGRTELPSGSPGLAVEPASPTGPAEPEYDPLAVVDATLRLLERERIPVAVRSLDRALESAVRLLRDLGVMAAELGPNGGPTGRLGDASDDVPSGMPPRRSTTLTSRELEVLAAMAEGLSNEDAGRRLGVAADTVKTYARRLFRKLDVTGRAAAVAAGYARGLLAGERS